MVEGVYIRVRLSGSTTLFYLSSDDKLSELRKNAIRVDPAYAPGVVERLKRDHPEWEVRIG